MNWRLLQTLILFIDFTGLIISLLFMVAQIYLAPYCTSALNITQASALLANTLTLFVGLMLIIDYNMEVEAKRAGDAFDTVGRSVISAIIVAVNLAVIAIPISAIAINHRKRIKKSLPCSSKEANQQDQEDTESNDADQGQTLEILAQPDSQQNQTLQTGNFASPTSGHPTSPAELIFKLPRSDLVYTSGSPSNPGLSSNQRLWA